MAALRRRLAFEVAFERADERGVRLVAAAPVAAAREHAPAAADGLQGRFRQQARFADARLASQHQERRPLTRDVAHERGKLLGTADEREHRTLRDMRTGRCLAVGGRNGRAMNRRFERRLVCRREVERRNQHAHGVFTRLAVDAAFQIADGAHAESVPLGQGCMSEASRHPIAFEQRAKAQHGSGYHGTHPSDRWDGSRRLQG